MKVISVALLLIALYFFFGDATKIDYTGYKIVRFYPKNHEEWRGLQALQGVGTLSLSHHNHIELLFPPHLDNFLGEIKKNGMKFDVMFEDLQKIIDTQKVNTEQIVNGSLEWDRYYRLGDIHEFLDAQAEAHPIASTFSIGNTYEGREMKVIRITEPNGENKSAVFVEAGIHSREWISPAVATFLIDQLLNSDDPELKQLLVDYDFYILPVLNADGYEYTHTTDRTWRKSRSINNSSCNGTDLNRNFDWHWMENGGASPDPCSLSYGGPTPFSDIEARNIRDFITAIASRLVFYLDLHSAGQVILTPTGLNATRIPQYGRYIEIARAAAEAHASRFGTVFDYGSIFEKMYVATGSSMDWVKGTLNTNLTLAYELRDNGQYGFLLPPEQILPSGQEFMDGFKVIMSELTKGVPNP